MQLEAIRTLWREIQKLQASKRDGGGLNTPSTPMTPLTPLTPMDNCHREGSAQGGQGAAAPAPSGKGKKYSEESVKELTEFCAALQSQVSGNKCFCPNSQWLWAEQGLGKGAKQS